MGAPGTVRASQVGCNGNTVIFSDTHNIYKLSSSVRYEYWYYSHSELEARRHVAERLHRKRRGGGKWQVTHGHRDRHAHGSGHWRLQWRGAGTAVGCNGWVGCFLLRALRSSFCFGGTPFSQSFGCIFIHAKYCAASRAVSKMPGSEHCLRFRSPPRPSPLTWRRGWYLPFLVMMMLV